MSKAEELIETINLNVLLDPYLVVNELNETFKYMAEMEIAMAKFVDRCEIGEIRSRKTYSEFKRILELE